MKAILGILLIILGIVLGLYLGLWVMFVGGIIQVVQNITPTVNTLGIGIGILRVSLAQLVAWLCFVILGGVGKIFLEY